MVQVGQFSDDLLRSWWVRRLAFVSHAGAASIATTQSYSRLEHSLGVLALVVNFAPGETAARAAALLHDIGHLPLSHTFEGLAGLNHHVLGHQRIDTLDVVLAEHGLSAAQVIAVDDGRVRSCLRGAPGHLTLDHLGSFLRSGQARGRTRTTPAAMLAALRLVDGGVDTDASTARELTELIVGEAQAQRSLVNVTTNAVIRSLAAALLERSDPATVAAMTDDELWAALLHDPQVGPTAQRFRAAPQEWLAELLDTDGSRPVLEAAVGPPAGAAIEHEIGRSYLDLPTVDGGLPPTSDDIDALARSLPLRFRYRASSRQSQPKGSAPGSANEGKDKMPRIFEDDDSCRCPSQRRVPTTDRGRTYTDCGILTNLSLSRILSSARRCPGSLSRFRAPSALGFEQSCTGDGSGGLDARTTDGLRDAVGHASYQCNGAEPLILSAKFGQDLCLWCVTASAQDGDMGRPYPLWT